MGSIVGGLVGAGTSILGARSRRREARRQRETAERAAAQFEPFRETGAQANEALAGALGLGGAPAQDEAFQNFLGSTGFRQQLAQGQNAIASSAAARGLLNSGATARRLTEFGQGLAQQGFSNFLGQLGSVANRGIGAAGQAASAITGGQARSSQLRNQGSDILTSGVGGAVGRILG